MVRLDNIQVHNIFSFIEKESKEEIFENILKKKDIIIQRIISTGQKSPENFWYNQDQDEWVLLLSGSATLKFKDKNYIKIFELNPGDYLLIPAHCEHRVERTADTEDTVWLAIFF